MRHRTGWFAIRKPLSPHRVLWLKVAAFAVPLLAWAVLSYVPFVWHPMVRVTGGGDSAFLEPGSILRRQDFDEERDSLLSQHRQPPTGSPANPIFLPAPHEVGKAFYTAFTTAPYFRTDPWLHQSLWHSVRIIFWGFVASAVVGVPVGILCGTFEFFANLVEPFVDFIRYMPAPAFGALALAVLGIEDGPKIAIIWIGTFFQMVLVVANTTRQLDAALLEAAQTLGAGRRALLTQVILPGVLPDLFNDMRILIGWAWTYLIVAELVGQGSGISFFINQQGKHFNYPNVYAGIIMIGIVGLVADQSLGVLGRVIFPWRRTEGGAAMRAFWSAVSFGPRKLIAAMRPPPPRRAGLLVAGPTCAGGVAREGGG